MARILVIEDESAIRTAVEMALTIAGHEPVVATSGPEGLKRLQEGPAPDLVVMDLFLPGLSGDAVLAQMRAEPALRDLPVILVTGAVPEDLPPLETYQGLITKPFRVTQILDLVKSLLGQA